MTARQPTGTRLPTGYIALTFDDGPGERTVELSHYLKSQGIPASFFMMGSHATGHSDIMQAVNTDGHIIGNHTWSHPLLAHIAAASVYSEINRTDTVLSPFYLGNMKLFRAESFSRTIFTATPST